MTCSIHLLTHSHMTFLIIKWTHSNLKVKVRLLKWWPCLCFNAITNAWSLLQAGQCTVQQSKQLNPFNGRFFQVIRSVGFPSGPPLFWKRTSANQWKGFIMGWTSFLIPNHTPKGKHSTNPNQWPRIILPSSTTRLLTEGALLHLCQLSDANISIARPNN